MMKNWFNQAVRSHERPLTRYVKNLLRALPPAQEVVQETFLKLWKHGPFEAERPQKVWLYKTSRNHAIDIIRKEDKMSTLTQEQEEELSCPNEIPSVRLEKKQLEKFVLDLVKELPPKTQDMVRLKFQEGLSYKEISSITGESTNSVGVTLHRAILHLRAAAEKGEK
ncbi:MAG: RNA polymerase subunit sigma-24 [Halobacteriovoraceae bacterium]|nr:RNA polymerase subunit sigma-24 [Halobacteriovoraceae bacterium]|tara:strand:- start:9200 stop:9700 length:501 start_codon:yes stop_codon:yes gene_type:complete